MRIFTPLLIAISLFCLITVAHAQSRVPKCSPASNAVMTRNDRFVEEVIRLTNIERMKLGFAPLKRQDDLCKSAIWHAQDMIVNSYFDHKDHLGRHIDERIPALGYTNYSMIGENIAGGQPTPAEVVAAWLKSPGHRANLLNPDFREIGVACIHAPNNELLDIWVQDFGSRAEVFPVIINLEAPQTVSPDVKLYVHGSQWAQKMRFSNDGAHWTDWENYQSGRDWKLTGESGRQTVYVELNNGADTKRMTASIELVSATASRTPTPSAKKQATH